VLMRTDALRKVGPFRGEAQYMIDLDMWCRLLAVGDLYAIPEPLAAFRVQDQSWSHALARRQSAQARALLGELRRRHPELVPWHVIAEGTARAWALGWGRRVTYRALRSPVLGAVLGITLATSETGGPG
jgi:hypothetical protein